MLRQSEADYALEQTESVYDVVEAYSESDLKSLQTSLKSEVLFGSRPKTAEEFFDMAYVLTGMEIPYTAVTGGEHNVSPLECYWRIFTGEWEKSLMWGSRLSAKALALDTLIPTPNGWTTMGEIKLGDQVFDENGEVCDVTYVSPIYVDHNCYEVQFVDGAKIICDEGHLWFTHDARSRSAIDNKKRHAEIAKKAGREINPKLRRYKPVEPKVRTTKEMLGELRYGKRQDNNLSIPRTKPLQLPEQELLVDPYLLGLWLGDGASTQYSNNFTTADPENLQAFIDGGYEVKHRSRYDYKVYRFRGLLQKLGIIHKKFIPEQYLRGSENQRLSLLQGLMDSDGTVDVNGSCTFTNNNKNLAEGCYELAVSLGYKASFRTQRAKLCGKDCGEYYAVAFTTTDPVCRLPRKSKRLKKPGTAKMHKGHHYIEDIVAVPSIPVRCIGVNSPNHLYLAGKEMIPTHNTWGMAFLELVLGIFEPGNEMLHAGGVTRQADVAMGYIDGWARDPTIAQVLKKDAARKANFTNGSSLRISPGKYSSIDGQHPNTLCTDEIKHWDVKSLNQVWKIPTSRGNIPKRLIMGSTNQEAGGGFNFILDEAEKRQVNIARWSIMETMQPCVSCKALDEEPHGNDETRTQACPLWTFCRGEKAKNATGWVPLKQVQQDIIDLGGIETPEARTQLLCLEPSTKGLCVFNFNHSSRKIGGNYTDLTYTPELPFYIGFDPSEGAVSAMSFWHYYYHQETQVGYSFMFDELVLDNCPEDTVAKAELYNYLRRKGYPDPLRIVTDPHRTDVIYRMKQGSRDGEEMAHRFRAVAPPIKDTDGGEEINKWLTEYRQEVCDGSGIRRMLINKDQCPRHVHAIKNWFYSVDSITGDVKASSKPKEAFKDENDSIRYWLRYKRKKLDKRGGMIDFLEV